MTTMVMPMIGASSADNTWSSINWTSIEKSVYRLQMRIAKAIREGKRGKVKALQWILTHSLSAKLLAVKRVTSNSGSKTPGIDGITWQSSSQKIEAVKTLYRRGYNTQPLRRIYIPKSNGKRRPLGIPTMKDRAMQALYLLALEPVAETQADPNSYGFRSKRSCADAIEQCFKALCQKNSAKWVLEGDIKSCFDRIDHDWLKANTIMDKSVLGKWLSSGYMEEGYFYETDEGTPQGGIISPKLATIALNGLEKAVKSVSKISDKVNVVIYADDFIITANSKELLENKIKPIVESFLKERNLELSYEKTKITHIDNGFDFLGFNIRKYNNTLIIKPSKKSVKKFLGNIRDIIKSKPCATIEGLIHVLNPRIRGWSNYYRHVVAKKIFLNIDHKIFCALKKWIRRKHPNKSHQWRKKKYFRNQDMRDWIFSTKIKDKNGNKRHFDLFRASSVGIIRHVKIKANANPFDPKYIEYFDKRNQCKTRSNDSKVINKLPDQTGLKNA